MPAWAASFAPMSRFPRARAPRDHSDIEVLLEPARHEPIDLELDLDEPGSLLDETAATRRAAALVDRSPIDTTAVPEILVTHLMEGIGLALDVPGDRMFVTDMGGSVYSAALDGKGAHAFLAAQGNLTGISYGRGVGPATASET